MQTTQTAKFFFFSSQNPLSNAMSSFIITATDDNNTTSPLSTSDPPSQQQHISAENSDVMRDGDDDDYDEYEEISRIYCSSTISPSRDGGNSHSPTDSSSANTASNDVLPTKPFVIAKEDG